MILLEIHPLCSVQDGCARARAAPFAHAARHLILSKHPDKKNEMRRTLFKMLANPDEDLKRRVEGHIRELRK